METFESLGIEYQALSRYVTKCPKCIDDRRNKRAKSLSVFIEPPYVRFQCHHPSCEWCSDKQQYFKLDGNESSTPIEQVVIVPDVIGEDELPFKDKDTTFFKYRDPKTKEILFLIARRGEGAEKWIRPFYKDKATKEWIMTRPDIKTLYRVEHLTNDSNRPVLVVEGEKAAEAAALIFTKADVVSWVGGAGNVKKGSWELLNGRKVVLWPDNDEDGRKAMETIAGLINTHTIHMVDVSSLPPKSDLADDISMEIIGELYKKALSKNIACPVVRGLIDTNVANHAFDDIKEGLPMGWSSVDRFIRLPTAGLVVIPGRTNHGKSAFMINVMANLLEQTDTTVIYLSYEMGYKEILLRLTKTIDGTAYSTVGYEDDKIYQEQIRNGTSEAFKKVSKYLADKRFYLTDTDIDVEEIVDLLHKLKAQGKTVVIFLDYIQLVPAKNGRKDQRYLEVKGVVEKLRHAANQLDFVIIGGSQLTAGETPFADSARESKDIENSAALILKIWNKDAAKVTGTYKTTKEGDKPYYDHVPGTFVVEVRKTRQGAIGKCFGFNFTNGCKLLPSVQTLNTEF